MKFYQSITVVTRFGWFQMDIFHWIEILKYQEDLTLHLNATETSNLKCSNDRQLGSICIVAKIKKKLRNQKLLTDLLYVLFKF